MKLSLVVLTPGKMQNKSIPITLAKFVIGRDPDCHLRPASALISKRHCGVWVAGEKAYVEDYKSTNGTILNGEPVQGTQEVKHDDQLKVGPLDFRIVVEIETPVPKNFPAPAKSRAATDDEAAALLLGMGDDTSAGDSSAEVDSQGIPMGSTLMEIIRPPDPSAPPAPETKGGAADREKAAKTANANTSTAAKAILEKYMRRPRGT